MKRIKQLSIYTLLLFLLTSCYTEVVEDTFIEQPLLSTNALLQTYDLWYVDINSTAGFGETPFLQQAFTISFVNGTLYANNNLVGIGNTGRGIGVNIANYNANNRVLNVNHVLDGFASFDVFALDNNTIELYNPANDTSYFLVGYNVNNFDYNLVFNDNIKFFLQEYSAWQKTFTSRVGAINPFDNENYLSFSQSNNDLEFLSSKDQSITNVNAIVWDYVGAYSVNDIPGTNTVKSLTLNYDFLDNDFFELSVITDKEIALYHNASRTTYTFVGLNFVPFLKHKQTKTQVSKNVKAIKKRKQKGPRVKNPRTHSLL